MRDLYNGLTNMKVKLPTEEEPCGFTWREVADILHNIVHKDSTNEMGYLELYCSLKEGTITSDAADIFSEINISVHH